MEEKTAAQWLRDEIAFMNTDMAHTLNGRLRGELVSCADDGSSVTVRYPVQEWQVNGLGTLHGGITSAMMDLTMSLVIFCRSRQTIPPTVSMSVNYLRPVPMTDYIHITASVTSLGRRNATAYCEAVIPSSGKTACTAIGTYAIIEKK